MRHCVVLLLLYSTIVWPLTAARADAPNIVLVLVDTLRADRLGAYGNQRGLTPFLDSLAQRGVVFANAYAPSSWTCPSVASLFTSRYPSQHGVVNFEAVLGDGEVTLAEQLVEGGYVAGGFSANFRIARNLGYAQGFADWQAYLDPNLGGKPRGDVLRRDGVAWAKSTLAASPKRSALLYLQYMEPHAPYAPPEPYRARFELKAGADEHTASAKLMTEAFVKDLSPSETSLLESLYDGEVAAVDAEIRLLFAELEQAGFLDHAIIVITADHGEEFGEHGVFLHGATLYNPSIRIPLIVIAPGVSGGRTVTENVSLLDLAPTLLELAGLPAAPTFEGRSLTSLMHTPSVADRLWARYFGSKDVDEVISELEPRHPGFDVRRHTRTIVDGTQKLLEAADGTSTLYDLHTDPGEMTPLEGPEPAARAAQLLSRLAQIESATKDRAATASRQPIDDATKEKLRALGYQP